MEAKSSFENVAVTVEPADLAEVEEIVDGVRYKNDRKGGMYKMADKHIGHRVQDRRGRWVPGVSGNPQGRPRRTVEQRLLYRLARSMLDGDRLYNMCETVSDKAAAGDLDYVRFVFSYLVGTPVARTDINITSGEETLATWLADLRETQDLPPEAADPISNFPDRETVL